MATVNVLLLLLGVGFDKELLTVQCLRDIEMVNIANAWECDIKPFVSEKNRNEIFISSSET